MVRPMSLLPRRARCLAAGGWLVVVAVWVCASSEVARADRAAHGGTGVAYSHKHQLGLHAQPGLGFRLLLPYNDHEYCGQDKRVCSGRSPATMDVGLSFGVSRSVEILFELRLGLENDFQVGNSAGPKPFALAPGIKVYVDDEGSSKFFSTLQLNLDSTDYTASGVKEGLDIGVRNANGLLIDLHPTFGLYLFIGETLGVVRWLRLELDAGIGLQARFP
jgi:hypothetical protein